MRINQKFRKRMLEEQMKKDDAEIRRYEKLLKLNKRRKKDRPSKAFCDMGLDYILDVVEGSNKAKEVVREVPESAQFYQNEKPEEEDVMEEVGWCSDSVSDEEIDDEDSAEEESVDGAEEIEDIPCDNDDAEKRKLREDIYGRLRDSHGNIITNNSIATSVSDGCSLEQQGAELLQIKKSMRGLINRVSEQTMAKVCCELDLLYRKHPRALANQALGDLVLILVKNQGVAILDRILLDCSLLVSILHINIGCEVGSYLIERLIAELNLINDKSLSFPSCQDFSVHNVSLFIMYLHVFNVINIKLPFDLLNLMCKSFSSTSLEVLILCLKSVGLHLRKADPAGMKVLIDSIQEKARVTDAGTFADSSRVTFMLDILLAIKNNNYRKILGYDTSYSDHLKKIMKQFLHKNASDQVLSLSLQDLRDIDSKGRWWIVGSSFKGSNRKVAALVERKEVLSVDKDSQKVRDLALKMGFKTEIRQHMFAALVTAVDVEDALLKLHKLDISKALEKDLVNIVIKCLLTEKVFNPFYVNVLSRLCSQHRRLVMIIKCAFWDQFVLLHSFKLSKLNNLSQAVVQLVLNKDLPFGVLKKCPFEGVMTSEAVAQFVTQLCRCLLAASSTEQFACFITQLATTPLFGALETSLVFLRTQSPNAEQLLSKIRQYKS